jgi:hypothetical protein
MISSNNMLIIILITPIIKVRRSLKVREVIMIMIMCDR